jgi:metallophosphoesterase (TIGR00282 family)
VFIGDIVGKPGRAVLAGTMPRIKKKFSPDIIVANGENAAAGFGITKNVLQELFSTGINLITSGNHIWDKHETESWIGEEERLIRPANFPPTSPGRGWAIIKVNNSSIAVVNIQGRVMMPPSDCPFRTMHSLLEKLATADAIVVDFHAEATSEKEAFARHFDGQLAAVIGTHTHVQTADERILPKGTAFISDIGFTGGTGGVIGYKTEDVEIRFLHGIPRRFEPDDSDPTVMGVTVEIENGLAVNINRFQFHP